MLIEHSHQSNHETNLTISLSDFHSLPLCTARDDKPPDKSTLDRSMAKGDVFWLQRVERAMNKRNTLFKQSKQRFSSLCNDDDDDHNNKGRNNKV